MTLKVGDKLPEATFMEMTADGPKPVTTAQVFAGKTVALFAVPGAYTPTCSARHLPGYVDKAAEFEAILALKDYGYALLRVNSLKLPD